MTAQERGAEGRPCPACPTLSTAMDPRRKRLLFRARHRGTRETDALIGGFVSETIATMDDAALDQLETVLALPDPDLFDWLTGRSPVPSDQESPVLRAMMAWAEARRTGADG